MEKITKLANAFYTDATPSNRAKGIARYSAERYKKKHGGLWVGGTVVLSDQGVEFSPNALNRKLHEQIDGVSIPASSIKAIEHKFGWFTGIVEVVHAQGTFRFRCYGAKNLVQKYNENIK